VGGPSGDDDESRTGSNSLYVGVQIIFATGCTPEITNVSNADIAGSRALELVPDDLKAIVENSSILYAPKPFNWMSRAHSTQLGHTLVTEGLEAPMEELGFEESKLKRYPMIWTNPRNGRKCNNPFSLFRPTIRLSVLI
jgi:hypothetical protein